MVLATKDQHFETVEEWRSAGSPEGTETVRVTIGTAQVEPTPEPIAEQEPSPQPTASELALREKELQEAIEFSERFERGEVPITETEESEFGEVFQTSMTDIKAKHEMLQTAREIEESYREAGEVIPEDTRQYIERARAISASPLAPFLQITPEGQIGISSKLATIEKAGVPLSELERVGFDLEALEQIERQRELQIEQTKHSQDVMRKLRKYPDLETAIKDGKIELIKEASLLRLIEPQQGNIPDDIWANLTMDDKLGLMIVASQSQIADIPRQRIVDVVPPLVITVEDGKESLNPLLAGKAVAEGKLHSETLRQLGYDITEEELANWARLSNALEQVKIKVTEDKELEFGLIPVTTTGYNYITAVKKGLLSADDLETLGFEQEDINTMLKIVELEAKLEPYIKTRVDFLSPSFGQVDYTDIGQAIVDNAVTKEELIEVGYSEEGLDKAEVFSRQGLKVFIPVYGTVVTWGVTTPLERGLSVAGDVFLIVPTVGWLGKAGSTAMKVSEKALATGIAKEVGLAGRVGAAVKSGIFATEQLAIAPVKFPYQLVTQPKVAIKGFAEITAFPVVHPLETAKGIGAITTGRAFLGEPFTLRVARYFTSAAIPEAAVAIPTKGTGVQRLFTDSFISRGVSPQEADKLALEATRVMQIKLSDMIVRGEAIPKTIEVPIMENGELKFTIKFDQTLVMRELGQAITATPFAERIFVGGAEPTPNKVYFSTAMSPEWTGVSARGYTSPEAIELGKGGALAKTMRINRIFDPVSNTYRNSVELEMTTGKGTQLVTGREAILDVLKVEGNVKIYPSELMPMTKSEDIIGAIRASEGKQFQFKPVNFNEVKSLPKGSGKAVEEYIRANDIMVGGSAAERTWTDTVKLPEDIDLISLKNNAKLDAERLAGIIEQTTGLKTRAIKSTYRDKWDLEYLNTKTNKWESIADVLDYSTHKSYNPDILNREPVTVDGIKVEHPLEQAERITAKYTEYQEGVPIERHRGHPKRLAWMAEQLLGTPGGKLTPEQIEILEVVGTRIDFPEVPIGKIIRMKVGGLRDAVVDEISKVIPGLRRGVRILTPDGKRIKVPERLSEFLRSFLENNPNATKAEINEVINRGKQRVLDQYISERVQDGTFRKEYEDILIKMEQEFMANNPEAKPVLKETRDNFLDAIEAYEVSRLHNMGRFTINEVSGMIQSGVITSSVARVLTELFQQAGDKVAFKELEPTMQEFVVPQELIDRRKFAFFEDTAITTRKLILEEPEIKKPEIEEPTIEITMEEPAIERPSIEEPVIEMTVKEPELETVIEEPKIPTEEPVLPPEEPETPIEEPERPIEEPILEIDKGLLEVEKTLAPQREVSGEDQEERIKAGTVVWIQGRPEGGAMWKVLPPPYRQEDFFTMRETPPGAVDEGWTGEGSTKESLQIIGGLPLQNIENIDLGWTRINVNIEGGKPSIEYVHDVEANVGERSKTVGMGMGQIPIEAWEEAKAKGIEYEQFISSYRGEFVGGGKASGVTETIEPTVVEEEKVTEEVEVGEDKEPDEVMDRVQELMALDVDKAEKETLEISEDETVVQGYVRRKKPKNMKNWWETPSYENSSKRNIRSGVDSTNNIGARRYLGHSLLPPDLGGEL